MEKESEMSDKLWRTLDSAYVVNSKYLKIRKEKVELPTGDVYNEYYINERLGWVSIFCVTKENRVILNRQYKHGIGQYVLELPAGNLETGVSPLKCAQKELLEETGYKARNWEYVGKFILDPTFSEGFMYLYYCDQGEKVVHKTRDPREKIETVLVDIEDLIELLRKNNITVIGHVAGIYTILDRKNLAIFNR
ncbi:hypothetical protein ES702_05293 [subsurface metagenome]